MPDPASEPMVHIPTPIRTKKPGGAKFMMVALIVLALTCVILYLLSLLNSKKYYLAPEGGELVVKKGILFPVGSERHQPSDPDLIGLYKSIDLPQELRQKEAMVFDDLPSLNREFAKHLIGLAREMIFSEDELRYRTGKSYLERAGNLQGLDANQLKSIQALSADVDYLDAKHAYMGMEVTLERALKKFQQAETFGTGKFSDVDEWIGKIQVLLEAIRLTKASGTAQPVSSPPGVRSPSPSKLDAKAREQDNPEYKVEPRQEEW